MFKELYVEMELPYKCLQCQEDYMFNGYGLIDVGETVVSTSSVSSRINSCDSLTYPEWPIEHGNLMALEPYLHHKLSEGDHGHCRKPKEGIDERRLYADVCISLIMCYWKHKQGKKEYRLSFMMYYPWKRFSRGLYASREWEACVCIMADMALDNYKGNRSQIDKNELKDFDKINSLLYRVINDDRFRRPIEDLMVYTSDQLDIGMDKFGCKCQLCKNYDSEDEEYVNLQLLNSGVIVSINGLKCVKIDKFPELYAMKDAIGLDISIKYEVDGYIRFIQAKKIIENISYFDITKIDNSLLSEIARLLY